MFNDQTAGIEARPPCIPSQRASTGQLLDDLYVPRDLFAFSFRTHELIIDPPPAMTYRVTTSLSDPLADARIQFQCPPDYIDGRRYLPLRK